MTPAIAHSPPPCILPVPAPAAPLLGRYRLGPKLATGGMASVYLAVAEDATYVARPLAVKRIHPHLATDYGFVEMFIDEARIASRLHHPNLCGVLDFGEADGSYFMTMEYLIGEPLHRLIGMLARRLSVGPGTHFARVAAQIISDACEGLHSAHELRDDDGVPLHVVHRDVTPSNIFVTYEGPTRVVDFGVASAANCLHHTSTGAVKGKFGYMSPEQFNGEKPDRSVDIWALGVVLWETIALRPLFRRANPSLTMAATLSSQVPPLHALVPGLAPSLTRIVDRALSKDPERRYTTASEMASDLQRFLAASGPPNGRAEIAALMKEVFPRGEAEKRLLIKSVLEERRSSVPPVRLATSRNPFSTLSEDSRDSLVEPAPPRRSAALSLQAPVTRMALALAALALLLPIALLISRSAAPATTVEPPLLMAQGSEVSHAGVVAPPAPRPATAPLPSEPAPPAPQPITEPLTPEPEPEVSQGRTAGSAATTSTRRRSSRREGATSSSPALSPSSAKAEPGLVAVTTSGDWAEIYHDGKLIGPTPARITLPEGRQVLTLRPGSGGQARTVVVAVRAGQTTRIRTEL